jgi:hypothetical protein
MRFAYRQPSSVSSDLAGDEHRAIWETSGSSKRLKDGTSVATYKTVAHSVALEAAREHARVAPARPGMFKLLSRPETLLISDNRHSKLGERSQNEDHAITML